MSGIPGLRMCDAMDGIHCRSFLTVVERSRPIILIGPVLANWRINLENRQFTRPWQRNGPDGIALFFLPGKDRFDSRRAIDTGRGIAGPG